MDNEEIKWEQGRVDRGCANEIKSLDSLAPPPHLLIFGRTARRGSSPAVRDVARLKDGRVRLSDDGKLKLDNPPV